MAEDVDVASLLLPSSLVVPDGSIEALLQPKRSSYSGVDILGDVVYFNCDAYTSLYSQRQVDSVATPQPQLTELPRQTGGNASRKVGGARYTWTSVAPALNLQPLVGSSQKRWIDNDSLLEVR